MESMSINWTATALGAALAYGLGMIWFSPLMFGKTWSTGSHNIEPPQQPPILAMVILLLGIIALAVVVGLTASIDALGTAIAAILAVVLIVAGMDLFSQKTGKATLVDAGYIVACGVLMIISQGIL